MDSLRRAWLPCLALVLCAAVSGCGSDEPAGNGNTGPQVERVTATPSSVAVGEATTVVAHASDTNGDNLAYQWTAGCEGTWVNATSDTASFTPSAQPPFGDTCASCLLTVTVSDGRGGMKKSSVSICVEPGSTTGFAPEVVEALQSSNSVPAGGGTVSFRVRAHDPQNSAMSVAWSATVGTLGTATHVAGTSEVVWTAPACVPVGTTPSVTATVTNALDLSTSASFTLTGGTACPASTRTHIAAGASHTLVLRQGGTVWAWGRNNEGQLGDGTTLLRSAPLRVQALTGAIALAAGSNHSVALKQGGTAWTWGVNNSGQLGDGTATLRAFPVQVQGLTSVTALAGGYAHTVALRQDGTVWAWGFNNYSQLGDGAITIQQTTPVQAQGLTGVTALAAGYHHTVALRQDGTVWAWGQNRYGQVGDGTTTGRTTPVRVQGLSSIVAIAVGNDHTAALRLDGTVWTWGSNLSGQLGDGTTIFRYTPIQAQGLSGVTALAAGGVHTVALRQNGTVWAWGGNNSGQLGDGTTTNRSIPIQTQGLSGVTDLAAGGAHTVALRQDGTVWAWGFNNHGQLGDGTVSNRSTPVQVQGLGN